MKQRVQVVPVVMEDGRAYQIHPLGYGRGHSPRHRVYRVVHGAGTRTLRRVTDNDEIAAVATRLADMRREAVRDIDREQRWGRWLVDRWRWVMVLLDKMRAWWRAA
jgi:hypothetical protein